MFNAYCMVLPEDGGYANSFDGKNAEDGRVRMMQIWNSLHGGLTFTFILHRLAHYAHVAVPLRL